MPVNFDEVSQHWKNARMAILQKHVKHGVDVLSETTLLTLVEKNDQGEVLKEISKTSEEVGKKAARSIRRPFQLNEVISFLSSSHVPCFQGDWKKENHTLSRYLYRGTCPKTPLSFCCDYWREAGKGIIKGLNSDLEISRHRSIGHEDQECLDYVYVSPVVNRQLGSVPVYVMRKLQPVLKRYEAVGIIVTLKGCSEHTLYLNIEELNCPLTQEECRSAKKRVSQDIKKTLPDYQSVIVENEQKGQNSLC